MLPRQPNDAKDVAEKMVVKKHQSQNLILKQRKKTKPLIPGLKLKRKKGPLKNLLKAKVPAKRKKALKLKRLHLMTIQTRKSQVLRLNQMTIQTTKNLDNSNRINIYNHEY